MYRKVLMPMLLLALATGGKVKEAHATALPGNPVQVMSHKQRATTKGSAKYFTGKVRVEELLPVNNEAGLSSGIVTFQPKARTAWHSHPKGQTLVVTAGYGRVQKWGEKVQEIQEGDVVWIPAGVKHWHGAGPTTTMTHIAIVQNLPNGKSTDWMEPVTDAQYNGKE